jgi:hypothetical protein
VAGKYTQNDGRSAKVNPPATGVGTNAMKGVLAAEDSDGSVVVVFWRQEVPFRTPAPIVRSGFLLEAGGLKITLGAGRFRLPLD